MRKITAVELVTAISACAASCLLTAGLVTAILCKGLGSSEAAGWAQALGSMAAIGGAFAIANRQHQRERQLEVERRNSDERRRFEVVRALLGKTNALVTKISTEFEVGPFDLADELDLSQLDDCAQSLAALPHFELPHEDLVVICASLPRLVKQVREMLAKKNARVVSVGMAAINDRNETVELMDQLMESTSAARRLCTDQIAKRRAS